MGKYRVDVRLPGWTIPIIQSVPFADLPHSIHNLSLLIGQQILCISPKTVERHRANIMNKLDLHNVSELTTYAIDRGLIER